MRSQGREIEGHEGQDDAGAVRARARNVRPAHDRSPDREPAPLGVGRLRGDYLHCRTARNRLRPERRVRRPHPDGCNGQDTEESPAARADGGLRLRERPGGARPRLRSPDGRACALGAELWRILRRSKLRRGAARWRREARRRAETARHGVYRVHGGSSRSISTCTSTTSGPRTRRRS